MNYYSPQEPQRQQSSDPYSSYNPYDPQQSQPTFVSSAPQQPSMNNVGSGLGQTGGRENFAARVWEALLQFFGVRGVVAATGAVLALCAFFLPYYSNYSAYFLAAETLDDKWWLELVLALLPLAILIVQRTVPRVRQQKRRWSLVLASSGLLGLLLNYWFLSSYISSNYWRFGAWGYFIGMALVAIAGLLLALVD